jgi:DNA-binding PadR family transcriptional regulator
MSKQLLDVLDILLARHADGDRQSYAYELAKEVGQASGGVTQILQRLEDNGYATSCWAPPTGPHRVDRHLYRLTPLGVDWARQVLELYDRRKLGQRGGSARTR